MLASVNSVKIFPSACMSFPDFSHLLMGFTKHQKLLKLQQFSDQDYPFFACGYGVTSGYLVSVDPSSVASKFLPRDAL